MKVHNACRPLSLPSCSAAEPRPWLGSRCAGACLAEGLAETERQGKNARSQGEAWSTRQRACPLKFSEDFGFHQSQVACLVPTVLNKVGCSSLWGHESLPLNKAMTWQPRPDSTGKAVIWRDTSDKGADSGLEGGQVRNQKRHWASKVWGSERSSVCQ